MSHVTIRNLRKQYGDHAAVADFSLDIGEGELVAFLGPSGCGKTTTLRMVAGFIQPTSGEILVNGRDITYMPPHIRNTGMVFQRYALFPHMTVAQNVAFGLQMRKLGKSEIEERVRVALDMVRLSSLSDRFPRQMSGGQQQRVAIARALAIRPDVFLLDEPLSNLDAKLRVDVREEIRSLQQELGLTTIFVTHDQEEALTIADRLAVMYDGRVQQIGTASELYEKPANRFVADFLGLMNFVTGRGTALGFETDNGTRLAVSPPTNEKQTMGVRPERVSISASPTAGLVSVPASIVETVYKGPVLEIRARTVRGDTFASHMPNTIATSGLPIQPEQQCFVGFAESDCLFFD